MDSGFDRWLELVKKYVTNERDARMIAIMCHEKEMRNVELSDEHGNVYGSENYSVWHNMALFYGTPCKCAKCDPERKRS